MQRVLSWLILGLTIPLVIYLIAINKHEFIYLFQKINIEVLIILLILQIPLIGLRGFPFKLLMLPYGYQIRFKDWIGLSFIATLLNQLLPYRPGIAFRYWYLKKYYHLKLNHFSFVTIFYFIILIASSLLMVMVPIFFIELPDQILQNLNQDLFIVLLILFVLLLANLILKGMKKRLKISNSTNWKTKWAPLFDHPYLLMKCFAGFLVIQILSALNFYTIFLALNMPLPIWHCIFVVGFSTLGLLFPITPGNIGIMESALGALSQVLYGDFSLGFSAMALFRAAQFFISSIMGSCFSLLLLGQFFPSKTRPMLQQ